MIYHEPPRTARAFCWSVVKSPNTLPSLKSTIQTSAGDVFGKLKSVLDDQYWFTLVQLQVRTVHVDGEKQLVVANAGDTAGLEFS